MTHTDEIEEYDAEEIGSQLKAALEALKAGETSGIEDVRARILWSAEQPEETFPQERR